MKATLTYNLPDEQFEFDAAVNGVKSGLIIREMDEEMRKIIKYEDKHTPEVYAIVERLRDILRSKCSEEGINL